MCSKEEIIDTIENVQIFLCIKCKDADDCMKGEMTCELIKCLENAKEIIKDNYDRCLN